jgi:DNA ligase D-like protein (predicted 3'-phosphoesterase)
VGLKEYLKKRNLHTSRVPRNFSKKKFTGGKKSGEPEAIIQSSPKKNIYVIQEHHASHLHWDLRLEFDGVLKSWAIPKVPPKKKGIKRLAISVEDHPINYAKFEGEIKDGYGKGTVKIWDKGNYKLIEKDVGTQGRTPRRCETPKNILKNIFTKGKIEIEIHGKKLNGKYVLVKTHYGNKPEKSWLFFRTA